MAKIKESLNHYFQDLAHTLYMEDLGLFLQFKLVKHIEEVNVRQVIPAEYPQNLQELAVNRLQLPRVAYFRL